LLQRSPQRRFSKHDEQEYSSTVTAVFTPEGHDADQLRATILEHFDLSLGAGLGKLAGKVSHIGHLGHFNDLMMGTLSGIELGLPLSGMPHKKSGVMAALDRLDPTGTATELELGAARA